MFQLNKLHKRLILLVIFLFFILIWSMIASKRGLWGDIACYFISDIDNSKNFSYIFSYLDAPTRVLSRFIPRTIFYTFTDFCSSLQELLSLYTLSHLLSFLGGLIFNLYVSYRTKQYHVLLFIFAYFFMVDITYISWFIRESIISVLIQGVLLQYFLTKENLSKLDIFFIVASFIFLAESFENAVVIASLYILFGLLFFFKYKNKKYLYYSGVSVLIVIYDLIRTYFILTTTQYSESAVDRWIHHLKNLFSATVDSCFLFSVVAFLIIAITFFNLKRAFKMKDCLWLVPIFGVTLLFIYQKNHFLPNPSSEMNLFLYDIIAFPIFYFILLIIGYLGIKLKEHSLQNILTIVLIAAIFQCSWQILSSHYFNRYIKKLSAYIGRCKDPISSYHFRETDPLSCFDGILCSPQRSIVLNKNKRIKTILISDNKHRDYKTFPFEKNYSYKEERNQLYFEESDFPVQSKYWDLSKIKNYIVDEVGNEKK